jgi:hypothetical protein
MIQCEDPIYCSIPVGCGSKSKYLIPLEVWLASPSTVATGLAWKLDKEKQAYLWNFKFFKVKYDLLIHTKNLIIKF